MHNKVLQQLGMALPLTFALTMGFKDSQPVYAQLNPDNTLGLENSIVTPQQLRDLIQGGAIRNGALFHSFDEFNVEDSGSVFFDLQNNTDILNIFTRVTGSNSSNILGTLGVLRDALNSNALGSANLFLLNPNGITFGANANLRLNGSFFATTADSFDFDNFSFSASGKEAPPPLLTVSIPRFLSFRDNPGNLTNQGDLRVRRGHTLGFIGGEVEFIGGIAIAPSGRIEVGAVGSNGLVSFTETDTGYVLGYEGVETFNDVTLRESNLTANGGGNSIQLQGRNITLRGNSSVRANTTGAQDGGDILINSEHLFLEEGSNVLANVFGSGQGGSITLNTSQLLIQDGSQIRINTLGEGNGGNLIVHATDSVQITGRSEDGRVPSRLNTQTSKGSGSGGDLSITTGQLVVQDGGLVSTSTSETGNAGNLKVNATDLIQVIGTSVNGDNFSGLFARTSSNSTGNGGNLTLNTSRLVIKGGAQVDVNTFGEGNGGNLTVNATEFVQVVGTSESDRFTSKLAAQPRSDATGNAGDLNIITEQLLIQDGGSVSTSTLGAGNGGDLTINAGGSVQVISTTSDDGNYSRLSTLANRNSTGNSGNLIINTSQFLVNYGIINAGTGGAGNGADIEINVEETILIEGIGSAIFNTAGIFSTGNAGDVTINAEDVTIQDGGVISVGSSATGTSGNLTINSNNLTLNNGRVNASTVESDGGNVYLNVAEFLLLRKNDDYIVVSIDEYLQLLNSNDDTLRDRGFLLSRNDGDDALISVAAGGKGNGGNLTIDTQFLIAFPEENSDIAANAERGNGGNINITATGIHGIQFREAPTQLSDITASSDFGVSGTVTLNTPEARMNQENITLPQELVNGSDLLTQSACYNFGGDSQLANTGRGGIPPIPGLMPHNSVINIDLVDEVLLPAPPPEAIKPHHRTDVTLINSEGEEYKPAMGAVLLPDGMVEFVDYNPAEVYRDMYASAGCNRLSNE